VDYEFQQHRLARIEAYNITRARLQSEFASGIGDPAEFEGAISEYLAMPTAQVAAWRQSEIEQAGVREGVRLAALEFYWEHRQQIRAATLVPRRLV
jgi:hypothetical protein